MSHRYPLLETMIADMANAPEIHRPTRFWEPALAPIVRDLEVLGIDSFRSHPTGADFFVPRYGEIDYFLNPAPYVAYLETLETLNTGVDLAWRGLIDGSTAADTDYKIFRASDTAVAPRLSDVSQDLYGQPIEVFRYDGRVYTAVLLRYLKCLNFLKRTVDTERIRNVLEIGGGFGTLGEIFLKSDSQEYFYLDVDIPPLAFVAAHYLQQVFGKDRVADYSVTRDLEAIDVDSLRRAGYRAAVICPWQLPRVRSRFELFCNSSSFQEMEPHVVEHYARHVSELVSDFLLLKNSRHGKQRSQQPGEVGVETPTLREDYLRIFGKHFEERGRDSFVFGHEYGEFKAEVMVLERSRPGAAGGRVSGSPAT